MKVDSSPLQTDRTAIVTIERCCSLDTFCCLKELCRASFEAVALVFVDAAKTGDLWELCLQLCVCICFTLKNGCLVV